MGEQSCHPDNSIEKSFKNENREASGMLFGFLNIYKPKGLTSHDVVARLRKITKIKQIGHTGTLDPFAEGVLPVCIGKSTRLIEYLDDDKEYIALIQFGKNTDTYDLDGQFTFESGRKVSEKEVIDSLDNFRGEIKQVPPLYSAIKVKGKKLYEYARAGEEVKVEPRTVVVEKLELISFDEENQQAEVVVKCSKGTYIRSLAYDIGKLLGAGAYLVKLIRTQAGLFRVENSVKLDKYTDIEMVKENLINPIQMLGYPHIEIDDSELKKVSNGMAIQNKNDISAAKVVILIYNGIISAVGMVDGDKILIKKVF